LIWFFCVNVFFFVLPSLTLGCTPHPFWLPRIACHAPPLSWPSGALRSLGLVSATSFFFRYRPRACLARLRKEVRFDFHPTSLAFGHLVRRPPHMHLRVHTHAATRRAAAVDGVPVTHARAHMRTRHNCPMPTQHEDGVPRRTTQHNAATARQAGYAPHHAMRQRHVRQAACHTNTTQRWHVRRAAHATPRDSDTSGGQRTTPRHDTIRNDDTLGQAQRGHDTMGSNTLHHNTQPCAAQDTTTVRQVSNT
jgi:hypothetical protein